jgi:hypothetical protein
LRRLSPRKLSSMPMKHPRDDCTIDSYSMYAYVCYVSASVYKLFYRGVWWVWSWDCCSRSFWVWEGLNRRWKICRLTLTDVYRTRSTTSITVQWPLQRCEYDIVTFLQYYSRCGVSVFNNIWWTRKAIRPMWTWNFGHHPE